MHKANMIHLNASSGAGSALGDFLETGGPLVRETEPQTRRWYALAREGREDALAIFDVFGSQAGRQAHFAGQVAAALSERAPSLVTGGWQGVLQNVSNLVAFAQHEADADREVRLASFIGLRAAPGRAEALEAFLAAGRDAVASTEPGTLYWAALRSEDTPGRFAIFDLFADAAGRDAHFSGAVAALLREKAADLVEGGWEQGVLAHVEHYVVRSAVRR